jgi:hypothetical protein
MGANTPPTRLLIVLLMDISEGFFFNFVDTIAITILETGVSMSGACDGAALETGGLVETGKSSVLLIS